MKIRVCGLKSARKVLMTRVWNEVAELEAKGKFADFGAITRKHWKPIKEKLAKKVCFDEEI